jgi:hypothetical protein
MPFGPASANVILSGESAASASSRSCGTADSKSKDLSVANYDSAEKGGWSVGARHAVPERDAWHHYANVIGSLFLRLHKFSLCHSLLSSDLPSSHRQHQLPDSSHPAQSITLSTWPNAPPLQPFRCFRQTPRSKSFKKKPPIARPAISGRTPRKRFSAKAAAQNQK